MKISNCFTSTLVSSFLLLMLTNAYSAPSFIAVGSLGSFSQQTGKYIASPVVYTTADGGMNWKVHILEQEDQQKVLESVSCTQNNQYCIAFGESDKPIVYTSTDGGENWVFHELNLLKNDHISSAICSGNQGKNCIAAGRVNMKAATLTSTDGGLHWTPHILGKDGESAFTSTVSI